MRRLGGKAKVGMAAVLAVLLAVTAGFGITAAWADENGRPALPKPKSGPCVASEEVMVRNHYAFILHQRDQTLRLGVRGGKYSLKECVDCHASNGPDGKPIPVNAPGQFCDSCHEYAAVSIDCFSCHATTPGGAAKTASAAGGAE